jgi:hypothetical protein
MQKSLPRISRTSFVYHDLAEFRCHGEELHRAQESEPDAVSLDPYARNLAGDRGMQIAAAMPFAQPRVQ